MIDKSDIKQWLEDTANLDGQAEAYNTKIKERVDLNLVGMMHHCFNDLSDQWVSAGNGDNLADNQLCWVLMPSGEVMVMRVNCYIKFGGLENCWQDLAGVDCLLDGTKYIEIKKPEPPK